MEQQQYMEEFTYEQKRMIQKMIERETGDLKNKIRRLTSDLDTVKRDVRQLRSSL